MTFNIEDPKWTEEELENLKKENAWAYDIKKWFAGTKLIFRNLRYLKYFLKLNVSPSLFIKKRLKIKSLILHISSAPIAILIWKLEILKIIINIIFSLHLQLINSFWNLGGIVFCFDFCAYHVWGQICPRLMWDLSKVTEAEKRESRKSFLKPRPHFWGRGCKQRPRNEQAEAEKYFRGSLFSTEVTWEKLKSDVDQISSKESSQHNYQNRMLFSFVWRFRKLKIS